MPLDLNMDADFPRVTACLFAPLRVLAPDSLPPLSRCLFPVAGAISTSLRLSSARLLATHLFSPLSPSLPPIPSRPSTPTQTPPYELLMTPDRPVIPSPDLMQSGRQNDSLVLLNSTYRLTFMVDK